MNGENLKQLILDYLSKNRRMTLATASNNVPWAATVFFAFDDNLNIYLISDPKTRKIQNVKQNPKVSCAINEYIHKKGYTVGLQLEGTIENLHKEKNRQELDIYRKRYDWADEYLDDHELFKIIPIKIIYLDDELFGPQGKRELTL
ncbi:MAG TPA: pyridoxamine 5'-phosphate oxidase family protein [Patescibacteria group bacterium]